jgi:hypothetical protein
MSANTVLESIEDRVTQLISQPLHPELFQPASAVTQGQVLSAFGNVTVGLPKEVIEALVEKVQAIKNDVRSWGLHQVRSKIVKHFNQSSPGGSYCTIGQVADYWKENGTLEAAAKLWYACYGAFNDEPGWEKELERSYMDMCSYTYKVTEVRKKGCFARTIGQRKSDVIKMINRASEKSHQGVIRMKRLPEEMNETTKFKKRKKGTTLGGFVKLDGHVKYKPEEVIPRVIHEINDNKVRGSLLNIILKQCDSNSYCCLLQIKAREENVDHKSPCKESPGAASPASTASPIKSPRSKKKTKGASKKKVLQSKRTNTARSFDEKEQVLKVSKKRMSTH